MPQQNSDAENDWHRRLLRAWGNRCHAAAALIGVLTVK
jgi:hypothetical protein